MRADERVRGNGHYKAVLGAGANKNRDKLIKHTVRVMWRYYLFSMLQVYSRVLESFMALLSDE